MITMLDRLARALFERFKVRATARWPEPQPGSYALDEWDNLPMSFKQDFLHDAEATLQALLTPTEGMVERGERANDHSTEVDFIFYEMIQAAIEGE